MEKPKRWVGVLSLVLVLMGLPFLGHQAHAAGKPIIIGAPLATAFLVRLGCREGNEAGCGGDQRKRRRNCW